MTLLDFSLLPLTQHEHIFNQLFLAGQPDAAYALSHAGLPGSLQELS